MGLHLYRLMAGFMLTVHMNLPDPLAATGGCPQGIQLCGRGPHRGHLRASSCFLFPDVLRRSDLLMEVFWEVFG